jgi:hypothetical protein
VIWELIELAGEILGPALIASALIEPTFRVADALERRHDKEKAA